MAHELTGRIKKIGEQETFGTFNKKEVWLETELDSKYPQLVAVEFTQDNISKLDSANEGDEVTIAINIRGRYHEGTDRVYNSLTGWKIEVKSKGAPTAEKAPPVEDDDDLPF